MFFIAFNAVIEKGGGTGPKKPWQPSRDVIGANSIPEMIREKMMVCLLFRTFIPLFSVFFVPVHRSSGPFFF